MNTKFRLLFTAFLCSISSVLIAQSVNINMAKTIAEHHMTNVRQKSLKSASSLGNNFRPTTVRVAVENIDTLYYILSDTINKGFVIVSADKRAWPIIAYSTDGSFNEKKQPEAFTAWMDSRKEEIESIKKNNLQPDSATVASWQNLSLKSSAIETTSVEPLILTKWDQGCYYNQLCPSDTQSPYCGHVPTGCTITAMAQIMKYWNYPTKGTGSHSYSHSTYGNLSADFGSTTYQWSQMPNNVTSPNDAVATLMYHCGVSLDTDYGPNASGAFDPRDELVQYFNYSSNAMLVNRSVFTTSQWIGMLKSELDLHHPIWYQGFGFFGHSFVCDGYQDANYFHFNWGWSGSSDGYFYIGNLNPGGNTLNENQFALISIIPGSLPDGYTGFFLSSNALDIATRGGTTSVDVCSSANWTTSSDQPWLSLSRNTGVSGKTTLILTGTENQTGKDRSATVTISAAGFGNQSITVSQYTNVNVTPGGLQNLITKNETTITKLTLSGTIDARDFKTMRDAMPALTDVDLSDATIVAYTGTEGTLNESKAYPANEIPFYSFYLIACQGQNFFKSVILPKTITSIGEMAFNNCKYLTTINIPSSVTTIGLLAFGSCSALINVDTNNPNYSSIDGVLFNKNKTAIIQSPVSKTGNYTIPSSVTSILDWAFCGCTKLTTVTIPSSVISIGGYVFYHCSGLTSVNIPSSVTSIGNEAFSDCSALTNVDASNPNYSSIDGVLFNKELTELIQCPSSKTGIYTIPSSVMSIGSRAFSMCNGLTSVIIPSSVTIIKSLAFYLCHGLTTVTIPSSAISIEDSAFLKCDGLRNIIIPSSVISIESGVFAYCSKLSSIFVYFISPFNLNSSIDVFYLVDKTICTVYVPFGSKALYTTADQWKDFTNIVEMPGFQLSATTAIVKAAEGSTATISISANVTYSVVSDQTWLTVSTTSQTGTSTLTFTASKNTGAARRTALVAIASTGVETQTITVSQEAENTTGIDQLSIEPEFIVYPNPSTGKVKLVFDQVPVNGISVTVNDITGKNCLKKLVREKEEWIDLSGNIKGIYFIKTDQENLRTQKVILK